MELDDNDDDECMNDIDDAYIDNTENIPPPPRKRTKYDIKRDRNDRMKQNRNKIQQIANKQTLSQQQLISLRKQLGNKTGNTRTEGEVRIIIQMMEYLQ